MTPSRAESERERREQAELAQRVQRRLDQIEDLIARLGPAAPGGHAFLVGRTTTVGTYPTLPGSYFAVQVTRVGGAEVAGGVASTTDVGGVEMVANVGKGLPPPGSLVEFRRTGGRWVMQWDG